MLQNHSQDIGDTDDTCHFVVIVGHVQSVNSVLAHVLNNGLEGHVRLNSDWFVRGLVQQVSICVKRVLDRDQLTSKSFLVASKNEVKD